MFLLVQNNANNKNANLYHYNARIMALAAVRRSGSSDNVVRS